MRENGDDVAGYDWTQFHVHMYYPAPIGEVFRRFATAEGLESRYVGRATFVKNDGTARLTRPGPDSALATTGLPGSDRWQRQSLL